MTQGKFVETFLNVYLFIELKKIFCTFYEFRPFLLVVFFHLDTYPRLLDVKCFFRRKYIFSAVVTELLPENQALTHARVERGRCTTRITPFSFKTQRHDCQTLTFISKTFEIKHDLPQGFLNQALTKAWVAKQ